MFVKERSFLESCFGYPILGEVVGAISWIWIYTGYRFHRIESPFYLNWTIFFSVEKIGIGSTSSTTH